MSIIVEVLLIVVITNAGGEYLTFNEPNQKRLHHHPTTRQRWFWWSVLSEEQYWPQSICYENNLEENDVLKITIIECSIGKEHSKEEWPSLPSSTQLLFLDQKQSVPSNGIHFWWNPKETTIIQRETIW